MGQAKSPENRQTPNRSKAAMVNQQDGPDRPVMTEKDVRIACSDINRYIRFSKKRGCLYPTVERHVGIIRDLAIEALRKREQSDEQ